MPHSFHILINAQAGTTLQHGQDAIRTMIKESGLPTSHLAFLETPDLLNQVKNYTGDDILLIGGGDGTLRSCAALMLNHKNPPGFGILPFGTMNLMAGDIGIPNTIQSAIQAYTKELEEISIDVGIINGEAFLCNAALGTIPESSVVREEHRDENPAILTTKLMFFVLEQMDRSHHRKIKMKIDNNSVHKFSSASLVIANNEYEQSENWTIAPTFSRISLTDGTLGVYSLKTTNLWDKLRFLFRLRWGGWLKDPRIERWSGREIEVLTDNEEELLSLDGEPMRFKTPLKFSILPQRLNLVAPIVNKTPTPQG